MQEFKAMASTIKKQISSERKVIRRISRGHQVTLPPHFLKENDLHIGDSVEIFEEEGKVTIQPIAIISSKDKSRLIQTIQNLFSQIDNEIPEEKKFKDEESVFEVIDQEIKDSRKL